MHFYKIDNKVIASKDTFPYEELIPNTTDGAHEKHVPVIMQDQNKVNVVVGSTAHPMLDAHYIVWIGIETCYGDVIGFQQKWLEPGMLPEADFALSEGEELVAAYEYCNLHGLWKNEA